MLCRLNNPMKNDWNDKKTIFLLSHTIFIFYVNGYLYLCRKKKKRKETLERMNKKTTCLLIISWFCLASAWANAFTVTSPNGRLTAILEEGDPLTISIQLDGRVLMNPSAIGLVLVDGKQIGANGNLGFGITKTIEETIQAPFYRQREYKSVCNQLDLRIKGSFGIVIRAYDEGVAYRFYTTQKGETIIKYEIAHYDFHTAKKAWLAYSTNTEKPFAMAFQNTYHVTSLDSAKHTPAFLPVTLDCGDAKVTLLESDLRQYPGMFVKANAKGLDAGFAPYPKKMEYYKWRGMSYVAETEDYIAKSTGKRNYPWRVFAVTERDSDMPTNNMVYSLAEPNKIGDTSWIKPGKVAWDWWNDWNLQGVNFEAGINMATYQYYIDFAEKNHLEYIVLDEGWYDSNKGDIMHSIPAIDLPKLIAYGKQKGVDIVLWAVFNVLDEHLDEACKKYADMGIKGFKVDFLDRNDQTAVEMAERIANHCAKYHLLVDYHGFYTPTGLSRTYPNVVNYEGVFGMEECRWAKKETDMPLYDVTFPFIRLMAGQVDFTPGAMRNGTRSNWVECYEKPVSMGTRCHQAACYVVHDSPFTMLCDAPTNYEREPKYTHFIATIPTVWDETLVLQGEIGKYIVTARRLGEDWYIGGQTNWDARTLTLAFPFLDNVDYQATLMKDGINAHHNAEDYQIKELTVNRNTILPIDLASGGGFVIKMRKR